MRFVIFLINEYWIGYLRCRYQSNKYTRQSYFIASAWQIVSSKVIISTALHNPKSLNAPDICKINVKKKLSYRWQSARCCFVKWLRYCRTFCLTKKVWLLATRWWKKVQDISLLWPAIYYMAGHNVTMRHSFIHSFIHLFL